MLEGEGQQHANLTVDGWMGKHRLAIFHTIVPLPFFIPMTRACYHHEDHRVKQPPITMRTDYESPDTTLFGCHPYSQDQRLGRGAGRLHVRPHDDQSGCCG